MSLLAALTTACVAIGPRVPLSTRSPSAANSDLGGEGQSIEKELPSNTADETAEHNSYDDNFEPDDRTLEPEPEPEGGCEYEAGCEHEAARDDDSDAAITEGTRNIEADDSGLEDESTPDDNWDEEWDDDSGVWEPGWSHHSPGR